MTRRSHLALVALLLAGAACEGSGSDIGPSIPRSSTVDYRVVVNDDQNRPVTNALISIQAFPDTAATGRLGRAVVPGRPSGTRTLFVDGTHASATETDRLASITVLAAMPDGDELPYVVHLPDTSTSNALTVPVGTSPGATLDDSMPPASGAILDIPSGTSVGIPVGTSVELRTGGLQNGHLPGVLPVPPSGARLWGAGAFVDPPAVTFSPGAALSMPNDLGLPAAATADLYALDGFTGIWSRIGSGTVDGTGARIEAPPGSVATGGLFAFATTVSTTTSLSGRVRDLDGNVIRGALVRAPGASTRSASDGSFALDPIAAVDAAGSPLTVDLEVHGGRRWRPSAASTSVALSPGQQAIGTVTLESSEVAIVRMQLIKRGRPDPFRRMRMSVSNGRTVGLGVGDSQGFVSFEDQRIGGFLGMLTGHPLDHNRVFVAEAVRTLPLGQHHVDLQVFTVERNWWNGRRRGGSTATIVADALGSGVVDRAAVVRGSTPGQGFVATTRENGVVAAEYGNVGQGTASVATVGGGVTVTSATTLVDIDSNRIEIPVERALSSSVGGFDAHGLVAGQLLSAQPNPRIRRLRSTRLLTLEDWYDEVFEGRSVAGDFPAKLDPEVTGDSDFRVGVPLPEGHLAAAEGTAGTGTFALERMGVLAGIRPVAGGEVQQNLTLDLVADTAFAADFSLTNLHSTMTPADLSFDLAVELQGGTLVDVVRAVDGNMTATGPSLTFTLPALQGVLAGGRHLVALHAARTTLGKTVEQHTFIPFSSTTGPIVRMLDVPDIVSPAPGATVDSNGFTVQFTIPISTLYTIVRLRAETSTETRDWTAVLPASLDTFTFRRLPTEAPQPLVSGLTWTLSVTAARVESGPLLGLVDSYRRMLQNYVSIGPSQREVNAYSSTSIQVTTN